MKTKVLMVDDEPHFTTGVKSNLEATGNFEVFVVNDSNEALEKVRETKPDLVLLDIVMPGVEGVDIIEGMEADPELKSIPILVVTAMIGHEDATTKDGVVKFGKHVLLAKPIQTEVLIRSIEDKLAGRI